MLKNISSSPEQELQQTRRQKVAAWFSRKKDKLKMNAAYAIATPSALAFSFAVAYASDQLGVDKLHTSTWVASAGGFIGGASGMSVSWYFMNREKYLHNFRQFAADAGAMILKGVVANIPSVLISWGAAAISVTYLDASALVGVVVQKITDITVFFLGVNFLHKDRRTPAEKPKTNGTP